MSLSLPLKVILWLLAFQSLFIERGASKIICSYCVRLSLCSPRPQLQQCSNYLHFTLFPANKIHSKRELNIFLTEMNLVQESKVQFHDLMYLLFIWLHRMLFSFFFFFFFFGFRASLVAYGIWRFPGQGSNWSYSCGHTPQPQQCMIPAVSATYTTAHVNARSLTY